MLFDLRGKGRRTAVKIIYSGLAILIGGGLVFFGIGSATSGGGLFDAFSGNSGNVSNVYSDQIDKLKKKVAAQPKNQDAWIALTRAQVQSASVDGYDQATGTYDATGRAELEKASSSWKSYLALEPKKPNAQVAALMVNAYGPAGLNDPKGAAGALKEVIASRKPNAALYAQLSILLYQAGEKDQAQLAEDRALELAPASKRKLIKAQLAAQKAQIDSAQKKQAEQQAQPAPGLGG
jgi:tetratricopeptide (TPR) repeat protein